MEEEWRPVVGFEGLYEVSNLGRVRSLDRIVKRVKTGQLFCRGQILKPLRLATGYSRVDLAKNKKHFHKAIHRLVAEAFIPNPEKKPYVNHINGERSDNRVLNLEWADNSDNQRHRFRVLKGRPSGCKAVRCIETGEIFNSISEAAQSRGTYVEWFSRVLNRRPVVKKGSRKFHHTIYGQHWEFVEKDVE